MSKSIKTLVAVLALAVSFTSCTQEETPQPAPSPELTIQDFAGDYQYTHNEGRIFRATLGPLRENAKGGVERSLEIVSLNVTNAPEVLTDFEKIDENSFSCVYHAREVMRDSGNGRGVLEIDPISGEKTFTLFHERGETYIALEVK